MSMEGADSPAQALLKMMNRRQAPVKEGAPNTASPVKKGAPDTRRRLSETSLVPSEKSPAKSELIPSTSEDTKATRSGGRGLSATEKEKDATGGRGCSALTEKRKMQPEPRQRQSQKQNKKRKVQPEPRPSQSQKQRGAREACRGKPGLLRSPRLRSVLRVWEKSRHYGGDVHRHLSSHPRSHQQLRSHRRLQRGHVHKRHLRYNLRGGFGSRDHLQR